MLRLPLALALLLSLPASSSSSQRPTAAQSEDTAAVDAALAKVAPSLVRIHVVSIDYQEGREIKREAAGSGTIITPEGHVLTNHHVAGRTRAIWCTLASREEIPADLVGTDPLSDIAVLKLRAPKGRTFPVATFGDSSKLKVGDRVLALGSPLALSQSVTMGIVSNTEMIMPGMFWPFNRMTLEGEDVGSIVRWIGHDAPIFGGNSGGPLVDMNGRIVGVNEISLGLAGAIPANLAHDVAESIIHTGKVQRSWIGLEVQPLLKSSPIQHGALVGGTIQGSPAAKAGFAPGDILVKLGGGDINVRFGEEVPPFNQLVMRLPLGKPVQAVVVRNGVEKTLTVTPEERQSVEAPIRELPLVGLTVSNLTAWSAKELNRSTRDGVRVRGVRPGGPAAEAKPPLDDDDVIVELDDKPVQNVDALTKIVEGIVQGRTEAVPSLVGFERAGERLLTVVGIGHPGLEESGLEARKPWLPLTVQVLTRELAEKLGVPDRMGVRITRVLDGAAEKAGLKIGDIITAIDGDPVQASQPSDADLFATMIRQYKIGSTVQLTVLRNRQEMAIKVPLDTAPRLPREMKKYEDPNFEFRVRDVAAADRTRATWTEGQRGVLVEAVREGGWAALGHLADGDLILAIDGTTVDDVGDVQQKMTEIAKAKPATVVLEVKRGIRTFFVEMQGGWK